jgi:hypothetical protein
MSQPKQQKQKLIIVALLVVGLAIALLSSPAPTTEVSTISLATVPVSAKGLGKETVSRVAKQIVPTSRTSLEGLLRENPFASAILKAPVNEGGVIDDLLKEDESSSVVASAPLTAVYGSNRTVRALIGQEIVREGDRLESGEEIIKIESRSLRLSHMNK